MGKLVRFCQKSINLDMHCYTLQTLGLPSPAFLLCPGDIGGLGLVIASGDNVSGLLGYGTCLQVINTVNIVSYC